MSYLPPGYPTFSPEELEKIKEKIEDSAYIVYKVLINVTPNLESDYSVVAKSVIYLLEKGGVPVIPLNFNLVKPVFGRVALFAGLTKRVTFVLEDREVVYIFLSKIIFERYFDTGLRHVLLHELIHASGVRDSEYFINNMVEEIANKSGGEIAPYISSVDYYKIPDRKSSPVFTKKIGELLKYNKTLFDQFRLPPIKEIIRKKEFEEEQKEETKKGEKKLEQSSLAKFLVLSLVIFALYCIFSGGEEKK